MSVACPPAFVYSNPELMDAIKSVIYKHGIQVTLPDAAAGHTQILITGFEDYAKAAADELEQCLKLQREKLLQLEGET